MRVSEPKDILKDLGMQVGGAKQELVDRILAGVPAWEEPEDLCFEYDVANPRVKTRWSHAECFARFPPLGIKGHEGHQLGRARSLLWRKENTKLAG